jgi:hypothetical protein
MEHWVLCNAYGTGAITLKWDMGILLTKVTHGVCNLKELRETTSSGNVLCLGSGLSNTRLFAGRPRHQIRSQKLASPRSGLPIQPTPCKIHIWKTMKRQRRRRWVPKAKVGSVTQVPENSLYCLPMRSPRRRLKTSTQIYRELDVRPRRRQVEEWPDHASVLLLVHVFTSVTAPPEIISYYRLNHSIRSLSDNKESSHWVLPGLHPVNQLETQRGSNVCIKLPRRRVQRALQINTQLPVGVIITIHGTLTIK